MSISFGLFVKISLKCNKFLVEDIRAQLDATAPKMKEHKDSLNALKDKQNLYKEKVDHQNRQIRGKNHNNCEYIIHLKFK